MDNATTNTAGTQYVQMTPTEIPQVPQTPAPPSPIATGETMQTPAPSTSAASSSSGWAWALWVFLGLCLFVGLLVVLFGRKSSTGGGGGDGMSRQPAGSGNGGGGGNLPSNNTYNISGGGGGGGNPDAVAYLNQQNAEVREMQKNMNDTCNLSVKLEVDGVAGTKTLAAIAKVGGDKGKQIAQAVQSTGYFTREQMDWCKKPCNTSGERPTEKGVVIHKVTAAEIDAMTKQQLWAYIDLNTGSSHTSSLKEPWGWTIAQIREWAHAVRQGKKSFRCTHCSFSYGLSSSGEYPTGL